MSQTGTAVKKRKQLKNRIFTVINPVSANGRTGKVWPQYESFLTDNGLQLDTCKTMFSGHAVQLVREALDKGYTKIMAVGGDGTVNEVVNGFFRSGDLINPSASLIVFSQGTGSDYIKSLGITGRVKHILDIAKNGREKMFDVGLIDYVSLAGRPEKRYFINLADAGLGGETVYLVSRSSKFLGGLLTYLFAALRTIIKYNNKKMELTIDGETVLREKINSIMVANGSYFAGGMQIAPGADLQDGEFNIIILGNLTKFEIITNLYKAYSGEHISHPKIKVCRGREVKIEADEEVLIDVDGEAAGKLPAKFKILERKLPVLLL